MFLTNWNTMSTLYRSYATLILMLAVTAAIGQRNKPPLLSIPERISEIDNKIETCLSTDEDSAAYCGVYRTTLIVNENNQQWRAVGNYRKEIIFWFNDQPRFVTMSDLPASAAILKITVVEELAIYWSQTDYYVNRHGKLIRVEKEETKGGEPSVSLSFQWDENGTIDEEVTVYDEEERDFIPKPDKLEALFSTLVQLFEATF